MNPCPEEQEDWVRDLRDAWPESSPPLHLRPTPLPRRKTSIWILLVPELALVALVVLFVVPLIPVSEPVEPPQVTELPAWPDTWTQPEATDRLGFLHRRREHTPEETSPVFVTRRPDLRLRLQRAGRRLNPNPIGS